MPFKTEKTLPVWLYIHGGGFAHGSYDARINFCKAIASKAGCIVVSVKYRLAPEHPFPAGLNDCYETLCWISKNADKLGGDKNKIAVGGESAGGNLSTCACLMARDKKGPSILHQTLLYAPADLTLSHPSIEQFSKGYIISRPLMENFVNFYIRDKSDLKNPYCSPLFAETHLLPPALVITAGYDPLSDEGKLYAEKLKKSGVPVVFKNYANMVHDFTMMMPGFVAEAKDSIELTSKEIKHHFSVSNQ